MSVRAEGWRIQVIVVVSDMGWGSWAFIQGTSTAVPAEQVRRPGGQRRCLDCSTHIADQHPQPRTHLSLHRFDDQEGSADSANGAVGPGRTEQQQDGMYARFLPARLLEVWTAVCMSCGFGSSGKGFIGRRGNPAFLQLEVWTAVCMLCRFSYPFACCAGLGCPACCPFFNSLVVRAVLCSREQWQAAEPDPTRPGSRHRSTVLLL